MKQTTKTFWRTVYGSSVVMLCLTLGTTGVCKAYESTQQTGFGSYRPAVELTDDGLRILDFEIRL